MQIFIFWLAFSLGSYAAGEGIWRFALMVAIFRCFLGLLIKLVDAHYERLNKREGSDREREMTNG